MGGMDRGTRPLPAPLGKSTGHHAIARVSEGGIRVYCSVTPACYVLKCPIAILIGILTFYWWIYN
jgi:hypothetical protein